MIFIIITIIIIIIIIIIMKSGAPLLGLPKFIYYFDTQGPYPLWL